MTGGTVVVLGPVGANFGAGMTGGRAFLYDPDGRHLGALDGRAVRGERLATIAIEREDGAELVEELIALLEAHRAAGSSLAGRLLEDLAGLTADVWLIEPIAPAARVAAEPAAEPAAARAAAASPNRSSIPAG
jgi:glutamate synthase domain-containing protein 3